MPATMIQYVFRPNPGADLTEVVGLAKEAANLWRAKGVEVSLWAVQIGEIGNMAFTVRAESAAKLGEALEAMNGDAAFAAWRARSLKSGLSNWVRSNQAYEIPI